MGENNNSRQTNQAIESAYDTYSKARASIESVKIQTSRFRSPHTPLLLLRWNIRKGFLFFLLFFKFLFLIFIRDLSFFYFYLFLVYFLIFSFFRLNLRMFHFAFKEKSFGSSFFYVKRELYLDEVEVVLIVKRI